MVVHISTAPRTMIVSTSGSPGCLISTLYHDATGVRKSVNTRKPRAKFSPVIGCHANERFVAFAATSRLRKAHTSTQGRKPARKILMLVRRLFQEVRKAMIATRKVAARASPA